MNRDDIIRMAREATRQTMDDDRLYSFTEKSIISEFSYLERFAALVAAAEREACAKRVSVFDKTFNTGGVIEHAIRARGQA